MKHGSERIKKDSERLRNAVREDQYKNPFKYTFDSYNHRITWLSAAAQLSPFDMCIPSISNRKERLNLQESCMSILGKRRRWWQEKRTRYRELWGHKQAGVISWILPDKVEVISGFACQGKHIIWKSTGNFSKIKSSRDFSNGCLHENVLIGPLSCVKGATFGFEPAYLHEEEQRNRSTPCNRSVVAGPAIPLECLRSLSISRFWGKSDDQLSRERSLVFFLGGCASRLLLIKSYSQAASSLLEGCILLWAFRLSMFLQSAAALSFESNMWLA